MKEDPYRERVLFFLNLLGIIGFFFGLETKTSAMGAKKYRTGPEKFCRRNLGGRDVFLRILKNDYSYSVHGVAGDCFLPHILLIQLLHLPQLPTTGSDTFLFTLSLPSAFFLR